MSSHKPFLIIVSAPSGCGKTTILNRVVEQAEGLAFSVSHTTRQMRQDEIEGRHYHFISVDEFSRMDRSGAFVESATVHKNHYGTSFSSIHDLLLSDLDVLLDIDVQGAQLVKANSSFDCVSIFILPPSLQELEHRLRSRNTDSDSVINTRLKCAREEMSYASVYDYTVINDNLDAAVSNVLSIINAERLRSQRICFTFPI